MRILRLNNNICELAEIDGSHESMRAEVQGYREFVTLGSTLRMVVNDESLFSNFKVNRPASQLCRDLRGGDFIMGPAFLCSFDGKENLVSLTDEDYEIAAKVLRSYGYVKGD